MDELEALKLSARKDSTYLALACSILVLLLFRSWKAALGVWIGAALSYAGLLMIIAWASSLVPENATKLKSACNYALRYGMYAGVMFFFTFLGIPVLSMLAGFLAGKASLIFYSLKNRKEAENGHS